MGSEPLLYTKRIRHLSLALVISGALNICVLSFLLYWMLRERPPTPYCELKPASSDQQQIPLADQRGCAEVLANLSQLSFSQLINRLTNEQQIENGYAERDLALACLITFHHFDFQRALSKNAVPQQKRFLAWKPKGHEETTTLIVYPNLSQHQYDSVIKFARTEHWPLTPEGLFLTLLEQKKIESLDENLIETFVLTPEFWTVELLFNRAEQKVSKQDLIAVLMEGNWDLLNQFVDQQRQLLDSSSARRQKFLLDYLKVGSRSAAVLLLKNEWDFAVKKLDDQQVIAILQLMPTHLPQSESFAKKMLASPRSSHVWREASTWLYANSGESMPKEWNYEIAATRFLPEDLTKELLSKSILSVSTVRSPPTSARPISQPPLFLKEVKPALTLKSLPIALVKIDSSTKTKQSNKGREYIVQQGDSLWKIARRFGVKIDAIRSNNELKSDVLKPGRTILIPDSKKSSIAKP